MLLNIKHARGDDKKYNVYKVVVVIMMCHVMFLFYSLFSLDDATFF